MRFVTRFSPVGLHFGSLDTRLLQLTGSPRGWTVRDDEDGLDAVVGVEAGIGGALRRVDPAATAYAWRDYEAAFWSVALVL